MSTASSVARDSTVPVGLFGLHTNTIDGRSAADEDTDLGGRDAEVGVRSPVTTSVPVIWQMCECSAYVGSNTSARRPGPPYASSKVWSTSLDPFAAKIRSAGWPTCLAIPARRSVAARSG